MGGRSRRSSPGLLTMVAPSQDRLRPLGPCRVSKHRAPLRLLRPDSSAGTTSSENSVVSNCHLLKQGNQTLSRRRAAATPRSHASVDGRRARARPRSSLEFSVLDGQLGKGRKHNLGRPGACPLLLPGHVHKPVSYVKMMYFYKKRSKIMLVKEHH